MVSRPRLSSAFLHALDVVWREVDAAVGDGRSALAAVSARKKSGPSPSTAFGDSSTSVSPHCSGSYKPRWRGQSSPIPSSELQQQQRTLTWLACLSLVSRCALRLSAEWGLATATVRVVSNAFVVALISSFSASTSPVQQR